MEIRNKRIKLNWDRLLGFNQVKRAESEPNSKSEVALLRAKIGAIKRRGINT